MKSSLPSKVLLGLMLVGLLLAGVGLGAKIRRRPPGAVTPTPASANPLTPVAGYLTWGGLGLVFTGFILLARVRAREEKSKAGNRQRS